jgi:hypothetical protein
VQTENAGSHQRYVRWYGKGHEASGGVARGPDAPPTPTNVSQSPADGSVAQFAETHASASQRVIPYAVEIPFIFDALIDLIVPIDEVVGVIAEEGDGSEDDERDQLHVTMFLRNGTDNVRMRVYAIEQKIAKLFTVRTFDFHTREAEVRDESPLIPSASFCLIRWDRP